MSGFLLPKTSIGACRYGTLRCRRVHLSVLGLARRGVQGMYGQFTAVADLLSARGADPTFAESMVERFCCFNASWEKQKKNVECTALVRSSVLGLAPRGVQGMYGHFTAVAQLLSPRGADPTFAESILSGFFAFSTAKDVSRCVPV